MTSQGYCSGFYFYGAVLCPGEFKTVGHTNMPLWKGHLEIPRGWGDKATTEKIPVCAWHGMAHHMSQIPPGCHLIGMGDLKVNDRGYLGEVVIRWVIPLDQELVEAGEAPGGTPF
jgi:hypothetical protein